MKGFLQWAEMQNGANSYSQALLTVLEDFSKFCFKLKDWQKCTFFQMWVEQRERKRQKCEVKSTSLPFAQWSQWSYVCCDYSSRPSQRGRKTRHGSLGRGTLIICDCPGSMMGNKLSVISHQKTRHHKTSKALALHQSPRVPHILAAEVNAIWETVQGKVDTDKWLKKCSRAKMHRTSLSGT